MKKSLLANRLFNQPLLACVSKVNQIAPFVVREVLGENTNVIFADSSLTGADQPPEKCMGKLGFSGEHNAVVDHVRKQITRRTANGIAVISIEGSLVNKGGWIGMNSGETSYQGIMAQVQEVMYDPTVMAVVFEIDSYGGEVAGCEDCASMIAKLTKLKPTIAILTDHAYSAAYWLASQCGSIFLPPAGGAGSIGVVGMHVNYSEQLKMDGVEVTVVQSGDNKTDGSPFSALPDAVREEWQKEFDILRGFFAEAVASGRGSLMDKDAALATEAKCFMGEAAVTAGLADAVALPSEAYEAFVESF